MELEKNNQYPLLIIRSFWHHIFLLFLFTFFGVIGSCSYLLFSKSVTYSSTGTCVSSYALSSTALDITVLNATSYDVYKNALSDLSTKGVAHANGEPISYSDLSSGVSVKKDSANYGYIVSFSSSDESIVVTCTNEVLSSSVAYCNSLQIVNGSLSIKSLAVAPSSNKHYSTGGALLIFASFIVFGLFLSIFLDVYYGKIYSSKDLREINSKKIDINNCHSFTEDYRSFIFSPSQEMKSDSDWAFLQNVIDVSSGKSHKTIAFSAPKDGSSYYLTTGLGNYSASISRKTCLIIFSKKDDLESNSFRQFPLLQLGDHFEYKKIPSSTFSEIFVFSMKGSNLAQAFGDGAFDLFLYNRRLCCDQIFLIVNCQEENPLYFASLQKQLDGVILSCFSGQGTRQSEVLSLTECCSSLGLPVASFAVLHSEKNDFKNFLKTHF
jgi:hypothetical protein